MANITSSKIFLLVLQIFLLFLWEIALYFESGALRFRDICKNTFLVLSFSFYFHKLQQQYVASYISIL